MMVLQQINLYLQYVMMHIFILKTEHLLPNLTTIHIPAYME